VWGVFGIAFLIGLDFSIALFGTYYEDYMAWEKSNTMISGAVSFFLEGSKTIIYSQSGSMKNISLYSMRKIPLIIVSMFTVITGSFFWLIIYTTTQKRIKEGISRIFQLKQSE